MRGQRRNRVFCESPVWVSGVSLTWVWLRHSFVCGNRLHNNMQHRHSARRPTDRTTDKQDDGRRRKRNGRCGSTRGLGRSLRRVGVGVVRTWELRGVYMYTSPPPPTSTQTLPHTITPFAASALASLEGGFCSHTRRIGNPPLLHCQFLLNGWVWHPFIAVQSCGVVWTGSNTQSLEV